MHIDINVGDGQRPAERQEVDAEVERLVRARGHRCVATRAAGRHTMIEVLPR
jgi:hypothetical protein